MSKVDEIFTPVDLRQAEKDMNAVREWRKKVAESIEFNKTRHFQIIDQLNEGRFFVLPEGWIGYANPNAAAILELPPDNILGLNFFHLLQLPPDIDLSDLAFLDVDYTGLSSRARVLELNCSPVQIGGEIVWFDISVHDVTIRAQRYEQLRVQSIMLDQLGEAAFLISPTNKFLYCNRKMEDLTGYSQAELLTMTSERLWGGHLENLRAEMRHVFQSGQDRFCRESVFRRKDGRELLMEHNTTLLRDAAGNVIGRITTARDVTERRQMIRALADRKAELRQLLDHMPATITRYDRSCRITYCNSKAAELMGKTQDQVIGRRLDEIDTRLAMHEQAIQEVLLTGRPLHVNFAPILLGGPHMFMNLKFVPIADNDDVPSGVLAVSIDVTAEWDARQELLASKIDAEIANRGKSEFLANMSHELRTPLNAIIGFSDLLSSRIYGPLNEKQVGYCRDIYDSGKHLLAIISEILDLSKIEAGRFELDEHEMDVTAAISNCLSIVEMKAQEKQITIDRSTPPLLPMLFADELSFKQILLNLLSNAVKFTDRHGRIRIQARVDGDGSLVIQVIDNGIGIGAKDLPKLFEPFQQAESGRARQFGGTGLGLSISKRMMDMHQGTITLESQEWDGTTATLRFPAARVRGAA